MNLFDPLIRDDESLYSLIRNSDQSEHIALRNELQAWFENYPESHKKRLQKTFSHCDRRQHLSAFFELYWHEWLRNKGFEIQCLDSNEPNARGGTPDYLVRRNQVPAFYLECTLAADSDATIKNQKKQDMIINWINNSGLTGLYVGLNFYGADNGSPNKSQFIDFLRRKIDELKKNNYDSTPYNGKYDVEWTYNETGINLRITPCKSQNDEDPLRVIRYADGDIKGGEQCKIQNALDKKVRKKDNCSLDIPFLISINLSESDNFGDTAVDDFTAHTTLLGNYSVNIKDGTASHALKNSFWFDPQGNHRHTSVSAVIWCSNLMPWNYRNQKPVVWHHPFAGVPLPHDLLPLDQMVPDHSNGTLVPIYSNDTPIKTTELLRCARNNEDIRIF